MVSGDLVMSYLSSVIFFVFCRMVIKYQPSFGLSCSERERDQRLSLRPLERKYLPTGLTVRHRSHRPSSAVRSPGSASVL